MSTVCPWLNRAWCWGSKAQTSGSHNHPLLLHPGERMRVLHGPARGRLGVVHTPSFLGRLCPHLQPEDPLGSVRERGRETSKKEAPPILGVFASI